MSQLTDWIKATGPDAVVAQLRTLPYWWPILTAITEPHDLYATVDALGLRTLDEARAWAQAANLGEMPNRATWQRLVTSPCSVDLLGLPFVQWPVLGEALHAQIPTKPDYWRMNSDLDYPMPTEAQLRQIARECPSKRYRHTGDERLDCDDHVNIARGWLSARGLRGMAGKAATVHYRQDAVVYGHAVLLAFSRETENSPIVCWWWEPQNGEVYPVSKVDLGSGALWWWQKPDRLELAYADF